MRVVCLGAAGGMGATAGRHLARLDGVHELVLADRDGAGLGRTVASLVGPHPRVATAVVDVLDRDALRRLLEPADLVLSCAGPFFRLGVPTLQAAIATGTTYVDICDDPDPTRAMLELDGAAREAGVAAVLGMGASPGLSNLLARRAAARLDEVHDCFTGWPLDLPAPGQTSSPRDEGATAGGGVSAAAVHLMEQISGSITVVEDGRLVERPPLAAVPLRYPGLGDGVAYTVGHPEPLTLVSTLGITGRAANVMLMKRATVPYLRRIRDDLDRGRLGLESAAGLVLRPPVGRSLRALAASPTAASHGRLPAFFALLRGTRGGHPRLVGCHLTAAPPGMDGATAIPAVLAVAQLLDHPAPAGVHPPDAVVDGGRLLADLLPWCTPSPASADELAPVVDEAC
ncbi:MAG: saccharopine dehydrogenase NADP-binding domain-containing protein [Acidimicrobiales bacterium]|nr:saccharopine dehydrogenase NADP-binding domain-containing protein [Acidimicrobiales bacterium]